MRLAVLAAIALSGLYVACGGVNMSDDQRGPSRAAANAGGDENADDDDDDRDAGTKPSTSDEDASAPATVAPGGDAGPSNEAAAPEPVPEGSFAAGTELETTANLNLREGPATTFAVVVTIPIATRVKVVKTSGADGWVNVDHQGTVGYASKTYLVVP